MQCAYSFLRDNRSMDSTSPTSDCPSHFALPDQIPVMVLSDCYLFPGCFLPLFIFEERYRLMLAHALATHRMFCVGVRKRCASSGEEVIDVSTAGLIRACVRNDDGTSHLMLHGLRRVRIKSWVQEKPFRIAAIEPLGSVPCQCREKLGGLLRRALDLLPQPDEDSCEALGALHEAVATTREPEMVCDILCYHFIRRAATLRCLLAEPSVERRFHILISELENLRDATDGGLTNS